MRMKLIIACATTTVCAAFVTAPIVSASPVLTDEGKAVAVGTEVKGKNLGTFDFSGSGGYTISCSTVDVAAKVTANTGTQIQLEAAGGFAATGTGIGGDCTANWGPSTLTWSKICFATVPKTDNVNVTGCGGEIILTTNITSTALCKYTAASWTGTFATNADPTFNMGSMPVKMAEGNSFFCPSEVTFNLDLEWTTPSGATLFIS